MNLINILTDTSQMPAHSLSMGGTLGLWDVARNKLILLPTYIVYMRHAKDGELAKLINRRIEVLRKQIGTIQDFFKQKDFDSPREQNLDIKLKEDAPVIIPDTILNDEEILLAMREHIRSVLSLETEALRNATIPEARSLIYDIMKKDNRDFSEILEFQVEKNWTDFPPVLVQH